MSAHSSNFDPIQETEPTVEGDALLQVDDLLQNYGTSDHSMMSMGVTGVSNINKHKG